jgi:hypothetical protein
MFQLYINRVQVLVTLEKIYLSYIVSNGDTFYIKVIAFDGIYNFILGMEMRCFPRTCGRT